MSAMENMVRTMLKALDVDVDTVKAEVTTRIVAFEENVKTLNGTLISIMETQGRMEHNLKRLMDAQGMEYELPPAKPINGDATHANTGNKLLTHS